MPQHSQVVLEPRKSPVQARSTASVDAILEATVQVLLDVGKDRLTTTRVAVRAGVSVGTLYQYFPNKSALLRSALQRHLVAVTKAVERVCKEQEGETLRNMATALITAFLQAKMRSPKTSVALYAVSSDLDAAKIVQQMGSRFNQAIVRMLATAREPLTTDPQLVASMLEGAMVGISRRMLESGAPEKRVAVLGQELIVVACAYLDVCSASAPGYETDADEDVSWGTTTEFGRRLREGANPSPDSPSSQTPLGPEGALEKRDAPRDSGFRARSERNCSESPSGDQSPHAQR